MDTSDMWKLLSFTSAHGYTVTVSRDPGFTLRITIHSPSERHSVRITLSDAEHLAVALGTRSTTPGMLVSFPDLDNGAVTLSREPSGLFRLTLSGVENWEGSAEFVNPDAERLAAVLATAAARPFD